jgi:adenylate kinase family enzyme
MTRGPRNFRPQTGSGDLFRAGIQETTSIGLDVLNLYGTGEDIMGNGLIGVCWKRLDREQLVDVREVMVVGITLSQGSQTFMIIHTKSSMLALHRLFRVRPPMA